MTTRNRAIAPTFLILVLAVPAPADTLRQDLKPLAEELLKTLEAEKQDSIAVGDFVGIAGSDGSAGPGLSETLKSLLEELKPGVVKRRAAFSLRGRYDRVADPRSKALIVIKITAEITDDKANRIDEKFVEIRDTATIAMLLNVTVALPPLATRDKRNEEMKKAFDEPKFQPAGSPIKAKPDSPFALELLVTTKDKAPEKDDDWAKVPARVPAGREGEAFVDIKRDEVYAVKVHNGTKREAAITLRIDGIDVFHFSKVRRAAQPGAPPKYKHYIVQPGQTIIPGWHKTNDRADSFLVTEYGKSAAAEEPTTWCWSRSPGTACSRTARTTASSAPWTPTRSFASRSVAARR